MAGIQTEHRNTPHLGIKGTTEGIDTALGYYEAILLPADPAKSKKYEFKWKESENNIFHIDKEHIKEV